MNAWHVWLWDTSGPGNWSGVAREFGTAREAAEKCITDGHAATATMQRAYLETGGSWMRSYYRRFGIPLTAKRDGDAITWEPAPAATAELVS